MIDQRYPHRSVMMIAIGTPIIEEVNGTRGPIGMIEENGSFEVMYGK